MIKKTRDEAYYWAAFHKEKKMYQTLDNIKEELETKGKLEKEPVEEEEKQETLLDIN
jgi:ERCC4-related helicase